MSIKENLLAIKKTLPSHVKLIAVSKTHTVGRIEEAFHSGHRVFGENRAQELIDKYPQLPKDIEWHFIGHLQTNKVKYIAPFISMIHSIDSIRLLNEINKEALKNNRIINCLLEMYIATEESKFGLDLEEAYTILDSEELKNFRNIRISGLMGMATFSDDTELVRKEFKILRSYFDRIKEKYFPEDIHFKEISMGMSGDYQVAIEEGSTMVRIGTAIFGGR